MAFEGPNVAGSARAVSLQVGHVGLPKAKEGSVIWLPPDGIFIIYKSIKPIDFIQSMDRLNDLRMVFFLHQYEKLDFRDFCLGAAS